MSASPAAPSDYSPLVPSQVEMQEHPALAQSNGQQHPALPTVDNLNATSPAAGATTVRFHVDEPAAAGEEEDDINATGYGGVLPLHENAPAPKDSNGAASNGNLPRNGAGSVPDSPDPLTRRMQRQNSFLEHEDNIRTVLVWQNLTVSSPMRGSNSRKVLLDNVSGSMTGGMWAVMGPSGCGKSTLLNTLACRLDVNTTVRGEMRLNGRPYAASELKKMSGYVMQDDLLNANLTVRETLHYTAALRLPASMDRKERDARVEEVIQEMGLSGCQNVIVGDPSKKGISGGERRRVCIGMELLTRPTLLFLDEPTSGLDSVTALALIKLLQGLTRSGKCSMMISIHQPQAKLFALFDRLLLLKSGRILFQGSVPDALKLFEDCGFPVPHYSNPADHLLDVITPPMDLSAADGAIKEAARKALMARQDGHKGLAAFDMERETEDGPMPAVLGSETPLGRALASKRAMSMDRSLEVERQLTESGRGFLPVPDDPHPIDTRRTDQRNEDILLRKFRQPEVDLGFGTDKPLLLERENVSWMRQCRILMERNVKEAWRKRGTSVTAMLQSIIMAVLIGTAFLRIGTGQKSTIRRQPVLFFVCINQGMFGALTVINSFPAERALMLRERAAGSYYASAYFLAKTTIDTLISLPNTLIFSIIVYWLVGLQPVGAKFIIFVIFMILCSISATSLALMVSALCKTTDLSVTVLPMVLEVARLFGSFFLAPTNLPSYFIWLDALSYIKYAYIGISLNELHGLELSCLDSELKTSSSGVKFCPIPDGQTTITSLGLEDGVTMGGCFGVLCGYIAFTRICAYLAIRFMKTN